MASIGSKVDDLLQEAAQLFGAIESYGDVIRFPYMLLSAAADAARDSIRTAEAAGELLAELHRRGIDTSNFNIADGHTVLVIEQELIVWCLAELLGRDGSLRAEDERRITQFRKPH